MFGRMAGMTVILAKQVSPNIAAQQLLSPMCDSPLDCAALYAWVGCTGDHDAAFTAHRLLVVLTLFRDRLDAGLTLVVEQGLLRL
jgi:hypothetical protein